jgi:thioredoxin reductase (NADPH)
MRTGEIFTKPNCSFCQTAKKLLERYEIDYEQIDVWADPSREAEMIERAGGRVTVPQVFIEGKHVGGADDLLELARNGGLDDPKGKPSAESDSVKAAGESTPVHEVVILGSGPAGLTAAIYCARANLHPVVVEGLMAGGQLMNTTEVENYPGFPEGIDGPELMERFKKQAARFETRFVEGDAIAVDLSSRPFRIETDEEKLLAQTLIIATGASPLELGVPGEKELAGRGVSYCATCDGFFFKEQEIVVVGGGDTAVEEALFLTRYGKRVRLIHRRDALRASKIMAARALANPKIEMVWDTVVEEVLGDTKVTAIKIKNVKTGETSEIACAGFFVGIGHVPNTELFRDSLPVDDRNYLKAGAGAATTIEGVFLAGDVHDHYYRQAVTAAGAGCKAAIECERWLEAEAAE